MPISRAGDGMSIEHEVMLPRAIRRLYFRPVLFVDGVRVGQWSPDPGPSAAAVLSPPKSDQYDGLNEGKRCR